MNLGYFYENIDAQIIAASGRELYYHTCKNENSTHSYEIDFLISSKIKIIQFEIKSFSVHLRSSITEFKKKYSSEVDKEYLLSQKDVSNNIIISKYLVMLSEKF